MVIFLGLSHCKSKVTFSWKYSTFVIHPLFLYCKIRGSFKPNDRDSKTVLTQHYMYNFKILELVTGLSNRYLIDILNKIGSWWDWLDLNNLCAYTSYLKFKIFFVLMLTHNQEKYDWYQPLLRSCRLQIPDEKNIILSYLGHHSPLMVSDYDIIKFSMPSTYSCWLLPNPYPKYFLYSTLMISSKKSL